MRECAQLRLDGDKYTLPTLVLTAERVHHGAGSSDHNYAYIAPTQARLGSLRIELSSELLLSLYFCLFIRQLSCTETTVQFANTSIGLRAGLAAAICIHTRARDKIFRRVM